jgi:hypothetical protein
MRVLGYGAQNSYTNVGAVANVDVLAIKTNVIVAIWAVTAQGEPSTTPTNAPAQAALQSYLNSVFGKQANVFFNVLPLVSTNVNYDLNGNGELDWQTTGYSAEMSAIVGTIYNAGAINVYYVKALNGPIDAGGITVLGTQTSFIQDSNMNSNVNVTAHELGHALGIGYDVGSTAPGDPDRLMWCCETGNNPCRLIRSEWRTINGNAP